MCDWVQNAPLQYTPHQAGGVDSGDNFTKILNHVTNIAFFYYLILEMRSIEWLSENDQSFCTSTLKILFTLLKPNEHKENSKVQMVEETLVKSIRETNNDVAGQRNRVSGEKTFFAGWNQRDVTIALLTPKNKLKSAA